MVHKLTRNIGIGSFLIRDITVSNKFRSIEDEVELFSKIVPE